MVEESLRVLAHSLTGEVNILAKYIKDGGKITYEIRQFIVAHLEGRLTFPRGNKKTLTQVMAEHKIMKEINELRLPRGEPIIASNIKPKAYAIIRDFVSKTPIFNEETIKGINNLGWLFYPIERENFVELLRKHPELKEILFPDYLYFDRWLYLPTDYAFVREYFKIFDVSDKDSANKLAKLGMFQVQPKSKGSAIKEYIELHPTMNEETLKSIIARAEKGLLSQGLTQAKLTLDKPE